MISFARFLPDLVFFRALLAGLIAVTTSFYLNIPYTNWTLLMIVFLAFRVQPGDAFVGAIARIAATVFGGIIGVPLTIFLAQEPLLLTIMLCVVVYACASFTSYYQGMAGYTSFLGGITCILVVMVNLNSSDQSSICYYAVNRTSEICIGVLAVLISSLAIWPTSTHDRLTQIFVALRDQLGQLMDQAFHPEEHPDKEFITVHTQLSRMVLQCDDQRYYTTLFDYQVMRISGYLQRVVLSVLNEISALTMMRRILVLDENNPKDCQAIQNAFELRYQQLDKELAHLIVLLTYPEQIKQHEMKRSYNQLLNLCNWRVTIYRCAAAILALLVGCFIFFTTGTPNGPMVVIGCMIITLIRILSGAPRIPLSEVLKAVLIAVSFNFITQYVLLPYIDNFWLLFLVSVPAVAFVVSKLHQKVTVVRTYCALLITVLMPIANPPTFKPLDFANNALGLLVGFFIGYLCIELIGLPKKTLLCKDYLHTLSKLLKRVLNNKSSMTTFLFRRQMLPVYFEMQTLFPDKPGLILNWMDTLISLGSTFLKLQSLDANTSSAQNRAIFAQANPYVVDLVDNLRLPTAPMADADLKRQHQLNQLFEQARALYNYDQRPANLDLLLLCGCLRRHHVLSFLDSDQPSLTE